jgi:hypothetical protein
VLRVAQDHLALAIGCLLHDELSNPEHVMPMRSL